MKKIVILLLAVMSAGIVWGQDKKVAMLEPVVKGGTVTQIEKEIILGALEEAITSVPGYRAFTRVDVNQITKELSFQQSGMVNEVQRKKIGQMSGASLICISQLTAGKNIHIKSQLVDVETGEIVNTASQLMEKNEEAIYQGCIELANKLMQRSGSGSSSPRTSTSSGNRSNGANYNPDGIEMVYVEGTGSSILDVKGFYIGKYEVTQAQWQAIMGNNPSNFTGSNNPVEQVSWNDVQEFIKKLNARTGRSYRLPTEAEWEYAAREGKNNSSYEYSGSNSLGTVAWYADNSGSQTHPVGQKSPNALGIYDMSGNVWEWCEDCYDSSCSNRVYRGGCWNFSAASCRVANRNSISPGIRNIILGFRLVLSE